MIRNRSKSYLGRQPIVLGFPPVAIVILVLILIFSTFALLVTYSFLCFLPFVIMSSIFLYMNKRYDKGYFYISNKPKVRSSPTPKILNTLYYDIRRHKEK